MDAPTDEALLEAWVAGDRRAGAALFERHYESIARFFAYKLGPDHDDLIQATFLGLLEGADRFRKAGSVRSFLFAIARHKLLKHLERGSRARKRFDPSKTAITSDDAGVEDLLVAHDDRRLLVMALRQLPLDTQIMLELHYWESMEIRDIALVFEMPVNTVKTRMRRGRLKLEELLEALAESPQQLELTRSTLTGWAAKLRAELDERGPP